MQGCLETKVSAVLSVSHGQQQPSSLVQLMPVISVYAIIITTR